MDLKDEKALEEKVETRVQERLQEEMTQRVDTAVQEREAQLREEFSGKLVPLMGKLKSDLREEVRGEMLSDPSIAGARTALEQVKDILRPYVIPEDAEAVVRQKEAEIKRLKEAVKERDLQLKGMEGEMEKLAQVAREAGYKYFVEKSIAGLPEANLIRNLLGDVGLFESADSLKEKLGSVQTQLTEQRDAKVAEATRLEEEAKAREVEESERAEAADKVREEALAEERERADKARSAMHEDLVQMKADNRELLEAVEKALSANKVQGMLLYAERKLTGNANIVKIRKILESTDLEDQEQIDEIIAENSAVSAAATDLESVRERVRGMSRGRGYSAREEERGEDRLQPPAALDEDYNGLGMSADRLRAMSGIS